MNRSKSKPAREETVSDKFMELHRRRFYSLYQNEFKFLVNFTNRDAYRWNDKGLMECECDYTDQALDITDDGWDTLRLAGNGHYPTIWPAPEARGALFNIPENAHKDWLRCLSHFIYQVEKIDEAAYLQYVTGYWGLNGSTEIARYIKDSSDNLSKLKSMIVELKVQERIQRIEHERHEKNMPPRPPEVKEGVTVRVENYEQTAIVLEVAKVRGGEYTVEICLLDTAFNGTRYWDKKALKPIVS